MLRKSRRPTLKVRARRNSPVQLTVFDGGKAPKELRAAFWARAFQGTSGWFYHLAGASLGKRKPTRSQRMIEAHPTISALIIRKKLPMIPLPGPF